MNDNRNVFEVFGQYKEYDSYVVQGWTRHDGRLRQWRGLGKVFDDYLKAFSFCIGKLMPNERDFECGFSIYGVVKEYTGAIDSEKLEFVKAIEVHM